MKPLDPKRARFAAEYLLDLNATAAAARAGYSMVGRSNGVTGHRLLQRPDVQAEVARLQKERGEKVEVNAEWVLRNLKAVAEQVDVTQGAKVRALELIGKHVGMFVEKHEHEHTILTPVERAKRLATLLKKGAGLS